MSTRHASTTRWSGFTMITVKKHFRGESDRVKLIIVASSSRTVRVIDTQALDRQTT